MKDFTNTVLEAGDVVAYAHRHTRELGLGLIVKLDRLYAYLHPVNRQCDNADFTVNHRVYLRNVIKMNHLKFTP
jgi:hypothetical protein